jgi:hypothetical protein
MLKVGDNVKVKNINHYDGQFGKITVDIGGTYMVLMPDGIEILAKESELKYKKPCTCTKSRIYPICDGSHSG